MAEGIRCTLEQAAAWIGAELHGANTEFAGVSSDSRQIGAGMLFVALRGPHHDGHAHVQAAWQAGAVAALVEQPVAVAIPQLVVVDSRHGLAALAAAWRRQLDVQLLAITGSNGKTTVKEMCAAILGGVGPTLATQGNLNNEIGVPLTLLRLTPQHHYAVIEMGANHPGEIARLTRLAAPQVALITNAGPAHLEGFGSIEGVAHAKGEIYTGLDGQGVAIINADDRQLTFGVEAQADVNATARTEAGGQHLTWHGPQGECVFTLPLLGRHNLANALAASAACSALGITPQAIAAGLSTMQPVAGRLQWRAGLHGSTILDDSYNANPASLQAGLEVLAACSGQRYLALGEMAELGEDAESLHRQAGEQARKLGIDRLYAYGRWSQAACDAFGRQGYGFTAQQALIDTLRPALHCEVTVLVKGSRASRMERVADALSAAGGQ